MGEWLFTPWGLGEALIAGIALAMFLAHHDAKKRRERETKQKLDELQAEVDRLKADH